MMALLAYYWTALPPVVPTHFGITGMPDAWGSKWLELLPLALGTVLYGGLTIMGRYPHLFNYPWPITQENAPQHYQLARTLVTALKTEIMWLFVPSWNGEPSVPRWAWDVVWDPGLSPPL